jgi:hypothetical protein
MFKLLVFCTMATTLVAQPTWSGLRFHMNQKEAKRYLTTQGFDLQPVAADERHQTATPNYELKVPGLGTLPFKAELLFDSSGLMLVTLALDVPRLMADVTNILIAVTHSAQQIHDAFVVKYGAPVFVDGPCRSTTAETLIDSRYLVSCKENWRGDSQQISVYWSYDPKSSKFAHFIQYQPQVNGL